MRPFLLAAALALSPPAAHASDPAKLVTKTFAVADLVIPIQDFTLPPQPAAPQPTTADGATKLVRTVTTIVRPHTWDGLGGSGKVEYFEAGNTLVVTNTQPVIEEVSNLLSGLRKLQETSVATEVLVVSVPAGFREWCPVKCADGALLCEKDVVKLLDFVQAHARANVMQAPKVTTFDGQVATVRVGEEKTFVTGVEAARVNGQSVLVPKNTPAHTGDAMTVCGRVGPDGSTVTLRVNVTRTRVADKVELVPVTTQVTPVFEGGSQGVPIPFTQFVQAPEFKTYTAERTATVPNCGTVVVGGWKEVATATGSFGPPTLSKIPYLNRLFKNVALEEREVLVLARTRVVTPPAEPKTETAPALGRFDAVARTDAGTPFATQATPAVPPIGDPVVRTQQLVYSREGGMPAPTAAQLKMNMAIVEVPADFMGKIGLNTDGAKDARTWTMTARERDLFAAALRNAADVKHLSHPVIVTHGGREATVRVGGTTPVVTGLDVSLKDGNTHVVPRTTNVDFGTSVGVTPHLSADGKFVRLHVKATHAQTTELGRKRAVLVPVTHTVDHGPKPPEPLTFHVEELPKQDVRSIDVAVAVPETGTVVVGGLMLQTPGGKGATGPKTTEMLIVLTPTVVKAKPDAAPASTSPVTPAGAKLPGLEYRW